MFGVNNCLLVQEAITAVVGERSAGDRRTVVLGKADGGGGGQTSREVSDGQLRIDIIQY